MIKPKLKMETRKFNRSIKKFMRNTDLDTGVVIRKIALDLLANILRAPPRGRHPVDTGRARAGWYMSAKELGYRYDFHKSVSPDEDEVNIGKREGRFTDRTKHTLNKYVELINGVAYIVFLEYGYSKQAPYGMVRISMRKMRGKMPKSLGEEYRKEWNKM